MMSQKAWITAGLIVGSVIGSYIPTLWGDSFFSYSSVLWSAIGSIIGIFIAYKLTSV